ncbi:MAG: PfkB family carbohydrate kinase [Candidatus Nanohalobium sp.]
MVSGLRYGAGGETRSSKPLDVITVGDVITDYTVDLTDVPDQKVEDWKARDWFPGPGESVKVGEVDIGERYIENARPGGRSANYAAAASRAGGNARLLGRTTGETELTENLEYDVEILPDEICETYIFVEKGENRISCVKSRDLVDPEYISSIEEETLSSAKYLLISNGESGETLETLFSRLEEMKGSPEVIFDPAPAEGSSKFLDYDCISYLTPNEHEYRQIEGLEKFAGDVIKTTSEGAWINEENKIESPKVYPADTTGAGDTFNGYMAVELSRGKTLEEAVETAGHAASLSVMKEGAQRSIPDFETVEWLLGE